MKGPDMKNSQRWQEWAWLLTAVALLTASIMLAGLPGRHVGAIGCLWISVFGLLQVYRIRDHGNLLQELNDLRRELEQLRRRADKPADI